MKRISYLRLLLMLGYWGGLLLINSLQIIPAVFAYSIPYIYLCVKLFEIAERCNLIGKAHFLTYPSLFLDML